MQPRNMSMSGVVDLAAVKAANEAKQKAEQARAEAARQGGAPAVPASNLVFDVDEAGFETSVLQLASEVPVVVAFWSRRSEQSEQLVQQLAGLAAEYRGRFVLAKVEGETAPMLLQQFAVQGVPAVFAVVAGQALPLFQGVAPEEQIRETLDQLIQVGEERFGLMGVQVADGPVAEDVPAPVGPYDALLDAAMDALNANDFAGAVQAYQNVLADDPANPDAKAGLAQAELLGRVTQLDPQQTRKDAADRPADVPAQIAAAELDLAGGHIEDAFGRLVDTVRVTAGDDRNAARVRLLELFEVVGADDPRVSAARTALARVLF